MKEFFLYKTGATASNINSFWKFFNEFADGSINVKMKAANKRSDPQNRYLWGCVYELALAGFRDLGYDEIKSTEDVHEIFKSLFLKRHHENKNGLVIEYVGSTAKLTKIEFMEYLERICRFCSENLSVAVPEPGQQILINY